MGIRQSLTKIGEIYLLKIIIISEAKMNTHEKYNTIDHIHLDMLVPHTDDVDLGLMLVECENGKWYIEQEFSTNAYDASGVVKSQTDIITEPVFYPDEESAKKAALNIVKSIYPNFTF